MVSVLCQDDDFCKLVYKHGCERFNADDYINLSGDKIKSCWELGMRISRLKETIKYWISNPSED